MMRPVWLTLGVLVLLGAWFGPLPALARESFAAHMTLHMTVVAVVAPLVAAGVSGTRFDPARAWPWLVAPVHASIVELVVVWTWHAPALHHLARQERWGLLLEQASFLGAALWLWSAAAGGAHNRRARRGAGVFALLLTSMHMTLLGALLALATRPLYQHDDVGALSPLADQQLGGAIMLLVGSSAYLAGGLLLTAGLLDRSTRQEPCV